MEMGPKAEINLRTEAYGQGDFHDMFLHVVTIFRNDLRVSRRKMNPSLIPSSVTECPNVTRIDYRIEAGATNPVLM